MCLKFPIILYRNYLQIDCAVYGQCLIGRIFLCAIITDAGVSLALAAAPRPAGARFV